jgi:hypothetical protein
MNYAQIGWLSGLCFRKNKIDPRFHEIEQNKKKIGENNMADVFAMFGVAPKTPFCLDSYPGMEYIFKSNGQLLGCEMYDKAWTEHNDLFPDLVSGKTKVTSHPGYVDLCKVLGVEDGEFFCIDRHGRWIFYRIHNLDLYQYAYGTPVLTNYNIKHLLSGESKIDRREKPTDKQIEIMGELVEKHFKYIYTDKAGVIHASKEDPTTDEFYKREHVSTTGENINGLLGVTDSYYKGPYNIEKLIQDCKYWDKVKTYKNNSDLYPDPYTDDIE